MYESLLNAFRAPDIRRRILFVLGILIVFRALAHVPVPGADPEALQEFFEDNALFGLLDLFSGGGLSRFSVVGLGVNPYINASIIMQLMTGVIPALQALQREGEYGRNKINQYTRYLSVPLAVLQSYGFLALLNSSGVLTTDFNLASFATLTQIITLTAGSVLLMWLGELITEKGIGNGISFIIFAGIVSRIPGGIIRFLETPNWIQAVVFVAFAVDCRGRRSSSSPRASAGSRSSTPAASGAAGCTRAGRPSCPCGSTRPASSRSSSPSASSSSRARSRATSRAPTSRSWRDVANFIVNTFGPQNPLIYGGLYFLLTVGFTYFYTAFTFKPDETAEQLRKNGGFIPGIRPGRPTQDYLARVVNRITVAGALFLGTIAVMPFVISIFFPGSSALSLGGTSLLIAVSVVVETMKQLEAQLLMRSYEGFIR